MGREAESIWVTEVNEGWQIKRSNPIMTKVLIIRVDMRKQKILDYRPTLANMRRALRVTRISAGFLVAGLRK